MAKSPAVLWYSADYLVGTMGMSWEEKGRYVELLSLQHQKGHLDIEKIMPDCPESVLDKFVQDDDGLYFNERMEEETIKRDNFTASRRRNLESKRDSHTESHMESHTDSHMENENEDVNRNDIDRVINAFNTKCISYRKVRGAKEGTKRRQNIRARIREYGIDAVMTVFDMAQESDFLKGKTGDWNGADFDWMMRPNNFPKILEGKYNNRKKEKKERTGAWGEVITDDM